MNKLILGIFLFFGVVLNSFSQKSLSDYSYIVVSEQFEFQKEKNKYELNSLMKFLFNKYGFHAFFDKEVPSNVVRCDGLWAEAEGTAGFVMTKVEIVLKDCLGNEVYRSDIGKSKEKEIKKAYYESVRNAFDGIKAMNVQQKEIKEAEPTKKVITENTSAKKEKQVAEDSVVSSDSEIKVYTANEEINPADQVQVINLPKAKYTSYSNKGKTYLLRKTSIGYILYQESLDEDDDLLLIGKIIVENSSVYFENENKIRINAEFDVSKNLSVGEGNNKTDYKFEN